MSLSLVGLVIVHKKNNTRCLDNTDERPVPGIEEEKKMIAELSQKGYSGFPYFSTIRFHALTF